MKKSDVLVEKLWHHFFECLDDEIPNPLPDEYEWRNHTVMHQVCEFNSVVPLAREMAYLTGRYHDFDEIIAPNTPTSIHHLHHATRWMDVVQPDSLIESVVEWGGGYGSLARILLDHVLTDGEVEYTIIDHPSMQRFARDFLGERDTVRYVTIDEVIAGALDGESFDLFVSTWALSESSEYAQRYVMDDCDLFGARHLLMAYDPSAPFEGAEGFGHRVRAIEGAQHFVAPVDGSLYVFR